MIDFSSEVQMQTTRSGGKGGQNVNKVETAVIAFWPVAASQFFSEEQKTTLLEKLANRINKEGQVVAKAQTHRTQLANKAEAIGKLHEWVEAALKKKKLRLATQPSKRSKEKRLEGKKQASERKAGRRKWKPGDF